MRENTPEIGVEVRGTDTEPLPQGTAGDGTDPGEQLVVRVAVPVVNPQSNTRDSTVDGDAIVGRIPVANADTPCADDLLDAAVVTVLEERVTAYYPRPDEGEVAALVWEAATDEWRCEEWELDGGFEVESGRRDDDEAVLWEPEE
ncbi:hypothetical protein M0R89_00175 [Halorussus limi]|uniref:Uncharacterized protein n=1 Tax=Halorussus limi TaxID=2938695 RepID=A0A8U0HTT4_9EURY|nr:hypothetical protein [Halorussus limi]UPV74502.1 hypothetical protein M0R89_00175 [Halorussus limi]